MWISDNMDMPYLIFIIFHINILFIKATDTSCLEAQTFIEGNEMTDYSFDDFYQPSVTMTQVRSYLRTCGLLIMDHLSIKRMCKKACSIHSSCAAYRFSRQTGCELCDFGIERQAELEHQEAASMTIGLTQFNAFIAGKHCHYFKNDN